MKYSKTFTIIISLCFIIGMLAACGSPVDTTAPDSPGAAASAADPAAPAQEQGAEEVVLRLAIQAAAGGFSDIVIAANERFMQNFPNVTVEPVMLSATGWGEQATQMMAMVAAGNAPDVTHMAIEGIRLMVAHGLLEPLDRFIENDPFIEEMKEDVHQLLWDGFTIDGSLYLLPGGWNNGVIYFNTRMFEEAGIVPNPDWNWAEFLEVAIALTTGEGDDKVFGYALPPDHFVIMPWILTNGVFPLKNDMTASNFNDPRVAEALQFVFDLYAVHGVAPFPDPGVNTWQLFASERIAMVSGGQWPVGINVAAGFYDFDILPFPHQYERTTVAGFGGYGILAASQNQEIAYELIKEYVSRETNQMEADLGLGIPGRYSISLTSPFADIPPNASLFYESLLTAQIVPSPVIFNEMFDIFTRALSLIYAGQMTAADAMEIAHEELTIAFEQSPFIN